MGIAIIGNSGTVIGSGEEARKPLHVQQFATSGNSYRVSAFTGTIGAALAANSELFQFRFVTGTKTKAIVRKVTVDGIGIVAVSTAIGQLGFMLKPARAWSGVGSGGTAIATTGDNLQLETAQTVSQVNNLNIATTGALTVGTKTKDANAIGMTLLSVGTGAVTTYQVIGAPDMTLMDVSGGGSPLVLADQEGFTIDTTHVGPATMTYVAAFTVDWIEVTAY